MTTVISRVYPDKAAAEKVTAELAVAGFPARTYSTISSGADLEATVAGAGVPKDDVAAYASMVKDDATLVVIRAELTPFGAARLAKSIADSVPSTQVPVAKQDVYIKQTPKEDISLSVLRSHPRFLSADFKPGTGQRYSLLSEGFVWRLIWRRGPSNSAWRGGGLITARYLPIPLLSKRKPHRSSVIKGGRRWLYDG